MTEIHLLVLIHGMWGNPEHLEEARRIIQETYPAESEGNAQLEVLVAETNREEATYDGIDWGGERVAEEILSKVEELKKDGKTVTKFSATGYSLGGLLARYVVGILYQKQFFETIKPINFNTIATPHIGLPRYPSFISSLASSIGPKLLSRTGEQFFCVDKWSASGRPLLEVMADPEQVFYQALGSFQNIRIYGNAVNDVTVPYVTSLISLEDPFLDEEFNGLEVKMNDDYDVLIRDYSLPPVPPPRPPKPAFLSKAWLQKDRKPLLPPALQFKFPYNILLYTMLPILIPTFMGLVLVRFTLASRSSRARIKLLEEDKSQSRLIHVLGQIEKDVEDAVADLIDETQPDDEEASSTPEKQCRKKEAQKPVLTPVQKRIVQSLNKLPIKKEMAYFPGVRNSHAMIVCRDVKRFELHKKGEGVLRHWAASFDL